MKKVKLGLLLFALFYTYSCSDPDEIKECLTICEECDGNGVAEPEDDILPAVEAPLRSDPKVIVILYHNLVYGRTGNIYNHDIYNFEHDLIYIRKNFKVIDFYDLEKINSGEMELTQDAAIITFDDGDLSIYPLAFPILKKYDLKATFFIVSSFVGEVGYISWTQLEEMATYTNPSSQKLFSIGSHSATHAALGDITMEEVEDELLVSKQMIESQLSVNVDFFSLPYGSGANNAEIIQKAKDIGYIGVRTSIPKAMEEFPTDLFAIPTLNIENYSNTVFINTVNELVGR